MTRALRPERGYKHPLCLPKGFPHETVEEFSSRVGTEVLRSYTSLCVVRHPLDRFISQYRFMLGRTETIPFMKTVKGIRQFIDAIVRDVELEVRIPHGVKTERMAALARPQHEYIRLGAKDVAVNHVFKCERLNSDWPRICRTLGVPFSRLPKLNESGRHEVDAMDAARSFVGEYYRKDFEVFGYERADAYEPYLRQPFGLARLFARVMEASGAASTR